MELKLKYGNDIISCRPPDHIRSSILEPPDNAPVSSLQKALISSINNPVDDGPLSAMIKPEMRITIVVPDKTRQCILDRILPVLIDYITQNGTAPENITILFANGTHQPQTEKEMEFILGSSIWNTLRVEQHNAHDNESMEYVTTTSHGTEIFVNKLVTNADLVITVGGILHHYFAGFGGGPKLLVPGAAAYNTAKQNHNYTIDETGAFHAGCRDGNLDTNPVYNDIAEAVRSIPNVFSINVVLDASNRTAGFFSGNCISSHRKGAVLAAALYEVPIKELADIVIVSPGGAPRDSTFIQSHKAIHHAYHAVKPGGSIIAAAACYDGIGSSTFLNWFTVPFQELGSELIKAYSLNGHTALSLRTKLERTGVTLLSELDDAIVSRMGIIPAASIEPALESITRNIAGSPLLHILPHGSLTVPILQD